MTECLGKNCTIIKKLLDSNSLNCRSCKKLLQLPVYLVDGFGNVCANCRLENADWKSTRNEIFNVLLQELIIPCTNASVGCNEEIPYDGFEEHLKHCEYRPVKCPRQGCAWLGRQDNLFNHFLKSHKEDVIESETFNFDFNLQEVSVDFAKLLIKANLKFLFLFQQDKVANELSLSLYTFHKNVESSTTFTFCNNEKMEWSIKTEINSMDLIDQSCKVKKINLTLLHSIFQEDNELTLNVNIPPNNHMLQILACPVCNETMRPPIYQCVKGHSICNVCVVKIKTCPTCQATINGEIRNYTLESATSDMFYSCSYKSSGCTVVLSGDAIMEHESNCLHHLYNCPLGYCNFRHNTKTILHHLRDRHVVNQFEFTISQRNYYLEKDNVQFIYISGCFFRVEYVNPNDILARPFEYSKKCVFIQIEHLNSEKKFTNLYCKNTLKDTKTQAEVTQIQYLPSLQKDHVFVIFVPIEALSDSIDVSRTGSYKFKCEILMK